VDLKEQKLLAGAVDRHWYYRSKASALARSLPSKPQRRVLDVGAGSGFFSRWLLERNRAMEATSVDSGYERDWDEPVGSTTLRFRQSISHCDADTVLMMDVLEHVEDDVGLLAEYVNKVPPDAIAFITVPAFPLLWSAHDEFLEHRRRYTVASLNDVALRAGMQVRQLHYYYAAIFPLAAAVRLVRKGSQVAGSDLRTYGPVVNGILTGICSAEQHIMRFNRLAGLSVFCTCSRK
jgi:2-polyprenyl-3-methyl-5-hydroxy-6-metoxy-1,4-benzoquinol methylase